MIPTKSADAGMEEIAGALTDAGVVVVTDILSAARREKIRSDVTPFMARSPEPEEDDPKDFFCSTYPAIKCLVGTLRCYRRTVPGSLRTGNV